MTDTLKRAKTGGRRKRPGWRRANVNLPEELWQELAAGGRTYSEGVLAMAAEVRLLRAALSRVTAVLLPGTYTKEE